MSANYTIAVWTSSIFPGAAPLLALHGAAGDVREPRLQSERHASGGWTTRVQLVEIDCPREDSSILIIRDTSSLHQLAEDIIYHGYESPTVGSDVIRPSSTRLKSGISCRSLFRGNLHIKRSCFSWLHAHKAVKLGRREKCKSLSARGTTNCHLGASLCVYVCVCVVKWSLEDAAAPQSVSSHTT